MLSAHRLCALFFVALILDPLTCPDATGRAPSPSVGHQVSSGLLPLRFERNEGQWDAAVRYLARTGGLQLTVGNDGFKLQAADVVSIRFPRPATLTADRELPGVTNYFLGADPARWRTNVEGYARLRASGIAPGIDAVFYENVNALEFDLVLSAGADPRQAWLEFAGASLSLTPAGRLSVESMHSAFVIDAPVAYQPSGLVQCRYVLLGASRVGFELGSFDSGQPLVIDPVLHYSTYLGGNMADGATAVAVDSRGSAYVVGTTPSTDFPPGSTLGGYGGGGDAFIVKVTPDGAGIAYASYLGGSLLDEATAVAVDSSGAAYIAGSTASSDFPKTSPDALGVAEPQVFVTKLSPAGTSVVYSLEFGGTLYDSAEGIAVDAEGKAYVTGTTASADFPTLFPNQIDPGDSLVDAFVTVINIAGSGFVASTYLGGFGSDEGYAIALDGMGGIFVVGETDSADFFLRNALQPAYGGGAKDAFVAKLTSNGTAYLFSTYLGGSAADVARGVACDPAGAAYVAGNTFSADFPIENAIQANAGANDAFVSKISGDGATLAYSTYLGGLNGDRAEAIAVDSTGAAVVVGTTDSANFPVEDPLQSDLDGSPDAFVTRITPNGTALDFSTYLAGSAGDHARGVAVDGSGNAYVAGLTSSTNFPVQGALMTDKASDDGFLTKIGTAVADLAVTVSGSPDPVRQNGTLTVTVQVTNTGPDRAGDVIVDAPVPAGATFLMAEGSQGNGTTPAVGAGGTVSWLFGALNTNASATLTIQLNITAAPATTVSPSATASTTALDLDGLDDTATDVVAVTDPIMPPVIATITKVSEPFKLKLNGANYQTGIQVFIGADTSPWPDVKFKSPNLVVLRGDSLLKARFPKGTPVTITLVNPDGGSTAAVYIR
jgi:uncharacterized repeat protein (TIGR01451 family)